MDSRLTLGIEDGEKTLIVMLLYGTLPLGIVLIPACWAGRVLVWQVHRRL